MPPRHVVPRAKKAVRELLLITGLYTIYRFGRLLANGNVTEAFTNADRVWHWERWLHLPGEGTIQDVLIHWEPVEKVANVYYTTVHFPATLAFLLYMYWKQPTHYVWIRRVLTVLTLSGLALHIFFPLAPPRMMPAFGMIDTGRLLGPTPYGAVDTKGLANQFAAMPSLHVGWALIVAIGLIAVGRSRWRFLWLLHPILTYTVVVGTANHYWMDGIVAITLLAASFVLLRSSRPVLAPRSAPTPTPARTTEPFAPAA